MWRPPPAAMATWIVPMGPTSAVDGVLGREVLDFQSSQMDCNLNLLELIGFPMSFPMVCA